MFLAKCAAAAATLMLAAIAVTDRLVVNSSGLGTAADTLAALGALVVCWVAALRARRTRTRRDAILAAAIGIISLVSIVLGVGASVPLALHFLAAAVFIGAAVAIMRQRRRERDLVLLWWAGAVLALALARVTWALSGVPDGDLFAIGDLVLLVAVGLLLMGARAELAEARRAKLELVLNDERRRLSREIHDGLAQELAFIVSQSRRLAQRAPNEGALELLARAGETALTDARRAIFNLRRPSPSALSTAIVERAFQKAERAGMALDVEVLDQVSVDPEVEHALLRIIDEAISNAGRHAAATSVSIRIWSEDERVIVRIVDDGRGFDSRARLRPRRFGLAGMTERAESLGGELRLESQPGQGTMIEVAI